MYYGTIVIRENISISELETKQSDFSQIIIS